MNIKKSLEQGFSILIPSWNNLQYLKECIKHYRTNSKYNHQIIVHVNEGIDGTLEWVKTQGLEYTYTKDNCGALRGTNIPSYSANRDFLYPTDDDNMVLPGWDEEIVNFIEKHDLNIPFWVSPTVIEPMGDNICCLAPKDYGKNIDEYRFNELLTDLNLLREISISRNTPCIPCLIPRSIWADIGGLTEKYGMGIGMEDDLAKKFWDKGCRNFVSVPRSLVYHFGTISTSKLKNRSNLSKERDLTFYKEYNIDRHEFIYETLKRGQPWTKI